MGNRVDFFIPHMNIHIDFTSFLYNDYFFRFLAIASPKNSFLSLSRTCFNVSVIPLIPITKNIYVLLIYSSSRQYTYNKTFTQ